jgi:hypothetical protein
VSRDGAFISRRGTGEGALPVVKERANSNGKWQMAKFKWFAIWNLPNLKPFAI